MNRVAVEIHRSILNVRVAFDRALTCTTCNQLASEIRAIKRCCLFWVRSQLFSSCLKNDREMFKRQMTRHNFAIWNYNQPKLKLTRSNEKRILKLKYHVDGILISFSHRIAKKIKLYNVLLLHVRTLNLKFSSIVLPTISFISNNFLIHTLNNFHRFVRYAKQIPSIIVFGWKSSKFRSLLFPFPPPPPLVLRVLPFFPSFILIVGFRSRSAKLENLSRLNPPEQLAVTKAFARVAGRFVAKKHNRPFSPVKKILSVHSGLANLFIDRSAR